MNTFLVQNFRKRSRLFRWTPQKHLLWLFNNSVILCLMTWQMSLHQWSTILNLSNKHIFQILFKDGFKEMIVKHTEEAIFFKHYPVTIPFTASLKMNIVRNNLAFFSNDNLHKTCLVRGQHIIFNKYHQMTPFILTRSTQRVYKNFITKFLLFLPLGWVQWNLSIRIRVQHTSLFTEFFFLRFLNIYYFKVFNF